MMEESKLTAAEEMKKRDGADGSPAVPPVPPPQQAQEKPGGLARFRPGSMSLRAKPKLFGKSADPRAPESEKLAAVPQGQTITADGNGVAGDRTSMVSANALAAVEEKKGKNRFSLGRKKSQGFL